jgi:hypothetical protein
MKSLGFFFGFFFHFSAKQLLGQQAPADTTYILKEKIGVDNHEIYIHHNPSSADYSDLSSFEMSQFEKMSYMNSLEYFQEKKVSLHHQTSNIPNKEWVIVHTYQGKNYMYHPCDFLFHFKQSINDTTWIDWTGEGPVANNIIHQHKIDEKTYEFELEGIEYKERKVIIHMLENANDLALFEYIISANERFYNLMIPANKITNLPVIVNHCPTRKSIELQFDPIDYSKWIEHRH